MNFLDIVLLLPPLLGAIYGFTMGLRPALWLLVFFLGSLLAGMLLLGVLERLILDLSGIGSDSHPDAPTVAVLILRGKPVLAYLAALIPFLITVPLIPACVSVDRLLRRFAAHPSPRGGISRIVGGILGIPSGILCSLLTAIQIIRLPWPPLGRAAGSSLFIAGLRHFLTGEP